MRARRMLGRARWVAIFAALALVAAACQTSTTEETTTTAVGVTTTTAAPATTTAPAAGFTYRLGIFQDTTTDNYWAAGDNASTVWNSYVLTPTRPTLYDYAAPGLELIGVLAASDEFIAPVAEGDGASVTVPMNPNATWSDGSPLTADDVVFTYQTATGLTLGGDWLTYFPQPDPDNADKIAITSMEAVDANTVKINFNTLPGLAVWPHGVGIAPIMSKSFWEPIVEEAKTSEDPATALYAASGAGDLSGGPVIFDSREEGAFARNVANANYYDKGREINSGGVNYTQGPFLSDAIFSLYADQAAAVLALKGGEIDYILNPLGMQRGLAAQVTGDENLQAVQNPTNGFRYLAFNLRKEPMSIPAFREALALMVDKEFMATSVLQGVAFELYATVPEGNAKWYNKEAADAIAAPYVGKPVADRLSEAVALLREAGFTWDVEPAMDEAGRTVLAGSGIKLNGTAVPELSIMAPGPGYDPLRATYSLWISDYLTQLGFEAEAIPTDFNAIVNAVFVPTEANELNYDMYILGWSLTVFPTHHESFFHSRSDTLVSGGDNNTGYNNPEFDALVDEFNATTSEDEAFDLIWQMEEILAVDKPYILLFDTGILEFYRKTSIEYPFESSLSGLQFLSGLQGNVGAAQ